MQKAHGFYGGKKKGRIKLPSLNKVILMGYLVADPELKQTPAGTSVVTFSIGVARKYMKDGKLPSDFFQVVAWDKVAETVCKLFHKGSCIIVCGSLQTRSYEGSDGIRRTIVEVYAEEVRFGEKKNPNGTTTASKPDIQYGGEVPNFESISADDGLPF